MLVNGQITKSKKPGSSKNSFFVFQKPPRSYTLICSSREEPNEGIFAERETKTARRYAQKSIKQKFKYESKPSKRTRGSHDALKRQQ